MFHFLKTALILICFIVTPACFNASEKTELTTSNKKTLIWDFDGTIADSMDNFLSAFNKVAPDYGLKTIQADEREAVRSISTHDLLKRQGMWLYQLPFLVSAVKAQAEKQISQLEAHKGLPELIQKLHDQGYELFIVSSSDLDPIKNFLKKHGIDGCFKDIYHASFLDSLYKARKLKNLMSKYHLDGSKTLYIGDEKRDIDASLAAPIPIIAVSWGFNSKSFLEKSKPTYVVDTASELESTIEKHFAQNKPTRLE